MLDGRCAGLEIRGLGSCMHGSSAHCPARRSAGLASPSYMPQTLIEARIASGRLASSSISCCCAANARSTRPVVTWLWEGVGPQAQRNGHPPSASQPSDSQAARSERGTAALHQRQPWDPLPANLKPQQQQQTQWTSLEEGSRSQARPSGSPRPPEVPHMAGQAGYLTMSQQQLQQQTRGQLRSAAPDPPEGVRRSPRGRMGEEWPPPSPPAAVSLREGDGGAGGQPDGAALTRLISSTTCWRQLSALVTQHAQHMNATHVTAVATRLTHLPLSLSASPAWDSSSSFSLASVPESALWHGASHGAGSPGSTTSSSRGDSCAVGKVPDRDFGCVHVSTREVCACLSFLCMMVRLVEERAEQLDARGIANICWALAKVLATAQDAVVAAAGPPDNLLTTTTTASSTITTTVAAKEQADGHLPSRASSASEGSEWGRHDHPESDYDGADENDIDGRSNGASGPQQQQPQDRDRPRPQSPRISLEELRGAVRAAVSELLSLPTADPEAAFRGFERPAPGGMAGTTDSLGRGGKGKLQARHLANMMWAVASLRLGCGGGEEDGGAGAGRAAGGGRSIGGESGGAATRMWVRKAMVASRRVLRARGFQGEGLSQLIWAVSELGLQPSADWMDAYYNAVLGRAATLSPFCAANVLLCLARLVKGHRNATTRGSEGHGDRDTANYRNTAGECYFPKAAPDPIGSDGSAALFHPPPAFWLPRFLRRSVRGLHAPPDPVALANSAAALSVLIQLEPYPAPDSPVPEKWLLRYYAALGATGVLHSCPDKVFSLTLASLATLTERLRSMCTPPPPPPPPELLAEAEYRLVSGLNAMPDRSFAMASSGLQRLQALQAMSRSFPHPVAYVTLREQQQAMRLAAVAARTEGSMTGGSVLQDAWVGAAARRLSGLRGRSLLRVLQAAAGWGAGRVDEAWLRGALDAVLRPCSGVHDDDDDNGSVGSDRVGVGEQQLQQQEEEEQGLHVGVAEVTVDSGWSQRDGDVESAGSQDHQPRLLMALLHVADVCLLAGSCPADFLDAVAAAVLAGAVAAGAGCGGAPGEVQSSALVRPWSASELLRCGAALARLGYRPPFAWRQAFLGRVLHQAALPQPLPAVADASAVPLPLQEQQSQRQLQQPPPTNGATATPHGAAGESLQMPPSLPSNTSSWQSVSGMWGRVRQQLHLGCGPTHRLTASDVWLLLYCSLSWSATASSTTLISLLYGVPYDCWEPCGAAEVCRLLALQVDALRRPFQQQQQPELAERPQQPQWEQREPHTRLESLAGLPPQGPAPEADTTAAAASDSRRVMPVGQVQKGFGSAPGRGTTDAPTAAAADDVAAAPGPDGSGSRQEPVLQRGPGRTAGPGMNPLAPPYGSPAGSPFLLPPVHLPLPAVPASRSGQAAHGPEQSQSPASAGTSAPRPVSPMMATWPDDSDIDVDAENGASGGDVPDGDASSGGVSNSSGGSQGSLGPHRSSAGETQDQPPSQSLVPQSRSCQVTIARRFTFQVLGLACSWLAHRLKQQQQQQDEDAVGVNPLASRTPGPTDNRLPSSITRSLDSPGTDSVGPAAPRQPPSRSLVRTPPAPVATGTLLPCSPPLEGPWSMRSLVLVLWSAGRLHMPLPLPYRRVLHTTLQGTLSSEAPRDLVPLLWSCCRLGVPLGSPAGLQAALGQRRELAPWALAPWQVFMMLEVLARWKVAPPLAWSQKAVRRLEWWLYAQAHGLPDVMLLLLATRSVLFLRNAARSSAPDATASSLGGCSSSVQRRQGQIASRWLRRRKGRQPGAPRPRPSHRASPLDPHIWAQLWPLLQAYTVRQARRLFGVHLSYGQSKASQSAPRLKMPFSRAPLRLSPPEHRLALLRCVMLLGVARDREWAAWGVPALQRLAHELDPSQYPAWLALVAHLQGYVSRSALEELLLGWCLACGPRLQGMSSFRLHNTLLSAARVSAVLRLPLSRCWCSEALMRYSRVCGQLRPGQLAAVPALLLALRRVPPPQWQVAYSAAVRRALPRMEGPAVAAMLRNAAELSSEMGGLLWAVVSEHVSFVKRQQQQQQQAELRREATASQTNASIAVRQQVLQQA